MTVEEGEALRLIDEARLLLRGGRAAEALHRVVDAAGLIGDSVTPEACGGTRVGRDCPTGRGFVVLPTNEREDVTT